MFTIQLSADEEKRFSTFDDFEKAWEYAKKQVTDLAEQISEERKCYVGISFEKENADIILHELSEDQFIIFHIKEV